MYAIHLEVNSFPGAIRRRVGLLLTKFGETHIHPTSEEVLGIPFTLAMAEQDEFSDGHNRILLSIR